MKTLGTALAIGAITLASLVGCGKTEPYFEKNITKYNGYDVMIIKNQLNIGNLKNDNDPAGGFKECLSVTLDSDGKPMDGIHFYGADGTILKDLATRFANPEKLVEIYNEMKGGSE